MKQPKIDESKTDFYLRVYDVLVNFAGARNDAQARENFAYSMTEIEYPCTEYRFCGDLGFGGKFWRYNGKLFVTCYCEDENPARKMIIARTNSALADLAVVEHYDFCYPGTNRRY